MLFTCPFVKSDWFGILPYQSDFFMAQNTITTKGALIINDKQKRLHYNENWIIKAKAVSKSKIWRLYVLLSCLNRIEKKK